MSLATLATRDDLENRYPGVVPEALYARFEFVLADASAAVRRRAGQDFNAAATTARFKIRNGIVRLAQRPVTAVTSVQDVNGNDVAYEWDGNDRLDVCCNPLNAWELEPYRNGLRHVDVTYGHGYTTIPDDIIGITCAAAFRALGQSPLDGSITQESIDGYMYQRGTIGAAGAFGFLPDELEILNLYRRVGGSMRVGP